MSKTVEVPIAWFEGLLKYAKTVSIKQAGIDSDTASLIGYIQSAEALIAIADMEIKDVPVVNW